MFSKVFFFFFSSRRRHTRCSRDWSSDVCSSDLIKARVQPFGFLAAAWGLAQKLQLVSLIDRHVPKRQQGASAGQYLVLAALNRLTSPNSKARMAQWYRKTPLQRWLPL